MHFITIRISRCAPYQTPMSVCIPHNNSIHVRAGKQQGVVMHVVNGARFKVHIPKQSCIVSLALAGVRCPQTGKKDGEPGEPYGEEAYQFSRERCLQHDVEVEIMAQDKIGTMIGRLIVHKKDHSVVLLQEGYGRLTGRDATGEMEEAQVCDYTVHVCAESCVYSPCKCLGI